MDTVIIKKREKVLAGITAAVLAAVLVFTAIIEPQLKTRNELTRNLGQLQIRLTKMKRDLLVRDRIDQIYSQIEPLIATTGTEQQQISDFTRQLGELYSKLNVKIRSVKILASSKEAFYRRLSIKMEMAGYVRDVLRFIEAVESSPNPIRIEQLGLKAQESRDNVHMSVIVSKVVSGSKT